MCDVCSTTLFNIHFTCSNCCLLVCLDCFRTRLSGSTEYKSSSIMEGAAATTTLYRSQRMRSFMQEARDDHMWPLCHRARAHEPRDLLLTKIIPNDAHIHLREMLHKTLRARGGQPTCECFPVHTEAEEKVVVAQVVDSMVEKTSERVEEENASRAQLAKREKSPVKSTLNPRVVVASKDKAMKSSSSSSSSVSNGSSEGRMIPEQGQRKLSLRVDKVTVCGYIGHGSDKSCGQDFQRHQMGYPQKRIHFLTHLSESISSLVPRQTDAQGMMRCPVPGCEFRHKDRKYMVRTHLAVLHGYLDLLYFKRASHQVENLEQSIQEGGRERRRRDVSLSNGFGKEADVKVEIEATTTSPLKKKHSLKDYRKLKGLPYEPLSSAKKRLRPETQSPDQSLSSMNSWESYKLKMHCEVCGEWLGQTEYDHHLVGHFKEKLECFLEGQIWKSKCGYCGLEEPNRILLLKHFWLSHGGKKMCMGDKELMERKRSEADEAGRRKTQVCRYAYITYTLLVAFCRSESLTNTVDTVRMLQLDFSFTGLNYYKWQVFSLSFRLQSSWRPRAPPLRPPLAAHQRQAETLLSRPTLRPVRRSLRRAEEVFAPGSPTPGCGAGRSPSRHPGGAPTLRGGGQEAEEVGEVDAGGEVVLHLRAGDERRGAHESAPPGEVEG